MPRGGYLGLAVVACLALAGCSGSKPAAKYRIAVIPKGTSHDFWKYIHAGAVHAARERGDTEIAWDGPAKEGQSQLQQQIVERFTSERASAIVLAPCDKTSLVSPVEGALKRGVPVVIMDSGLDMTDTISSNANYLGYVATDNRQGGVEAARRLLEVLKGKDHPKVILLRYKRGSESTEQREAGFRETIQAAAHVQLTEASDEAGDTVDTAQQVAERLLSDHKDLDGLFAPNESSSTGVLRAMEVLNRVGTLKVVGFDANDILLAALRTDKIHGLVLQDPFDMGYQAVLRAVDHLEGKPPPKDKIKNTNLKVATKENMDDPVIKSLYARDLARYLSD
jgi:ribose transport system substrate-binding protein